MATTNPILETTSASAQSGPGLLVLLSSMEPESLEGVLANLASLPGAERTVVATPDAPPADSWPADKVISVPSAISSWTLTAADFAIARQLAEQRDAQAVLILGPGAESLSLAGLRSLSDAVLSTPADLAIPCYDLPPRAGLVNSAILYPLTRALFASRARFPLAIDLGLSRRMVERLGSIAQRFTTLNQSDALVWPVNEAAVAGLTVNEFDVGTRSQPQPSDPDINSILASITGALFSDIDAKAAFWQRTRQAPAARHPLRAAPGSRYPGGYHPHARCVSPGIRQSARYRVAGAAPNTLIGLKRLYSTEGSAFQLPDHLWARIVYDFLLAYRLRTLNRGHLLGALIPLYLAWVASHINITTTGTGIDQHVEAVAAAFEAEKPYLVSRWRWPDRFNP